MDRMYGVENAVRMLRRFSAIQRDSAGRLGTERERGLWSMEHEVWSCDVMRCDAVRHAVARRPAHSKTNDARESTRPMRTWPSRQSSMRNMGGRRGAGGRSQRRPDPPRLDEMKMKRDGTRRE